MKRLNSITILLFLLPVLGFTQDLKVMSYNIKYDNVNDTVNNWNDRKMPMVEVLKKRHPEFIGMQEVLYRQLDYLNSALEDYDYIGVGRDDGKQKGEFSPIFYDTERFKLLESNTFWLSKTPTLISVGWDAAMERICTYGLFEDKSTGKKMYVFNTHFDHIGTKARKNAAKLILRQIAKRNKQKLPVILMGDFNLRPTEKPILFIKKRMEDGHAISKNAVQGPKGTYNGFDRNAPINRRIDYIFLQGWTVSQYEHLDARLKNGKHVSDHLPVLATIAIP
ncbi:endonuclease/exonuclease/phosphatase family protein [Maribacter sp.]